MSDSNQMVVDITKTQEDNLFDLMRKMGTPESVFPDIEKTICDVIPLNEKDTINGVKLNAFLEVFIKEKSLTHAKYKAIYFSSKYNRVSFDFDGSKNYQMVVQESVHGVMNDKEALQKTTELVNSLPFYSNSKLTPFNCKIEEITKGKKLLTIVSHPNSPTYIGTKTVPYTYVYDISGSFDFNYGVMAKISKKDILPETALVDGKETRLAVDLESLRFTDDRLLEAHNTYTVGVFKEGYNNSPFRKADWLDKIPGVILTPMEDEVIGREIKHQGIYPKDLDFKRSTGFKSTLLTTSNREYSGLQKITIVQRDVAILFNKQLDDIKPIKDLNGIKYFSHRTKTSKYPEEINYDIIVKKQFLSNGQSIFIVDVLGGEATEYDTSDSQGLTDEVFKSFMKENHLVLLNGQTSNMFDNQEHILDKDYNDLSKEFLPFMEDFCHLAIYQFNNKPTDFFSGYFHVIYNKPYNHIDAPDKLLGFIDGSTGYHRIPRSLNGFEY